MSHFTRLQFHPRSGIRTATLVALLITALVAGLTGAGPLPPKPASAEEIVPITLTASEYKSVPFSDSKSAVPLYSRDIFVTTRETVDGVIAVVDATKGDVHASSPFGRAEWVARVPDPKEQANVLLSWSSVWAQLTAFVVKGDGSKVIRAAWMDEPEEDVTGLCTGINSEGERTAVLVTKGGWVKYYLLDVDHEDHGQVEVEMRRVQTKFLPLQANEIPSACAIHGVAPHHALIATELGTVYEVDFGSPASPLPKPIYRAAEEVPAIAPFYVSGDENTAYVLVAEKDEALTILSRSRSTAAWQKVQSITLKPTVEMEDLSGLSIVSSGLGFDNGVLAATSETGSHFFALDRVLESANVIQRGARVLGDLPKTMQREPTCDADECSDNGFCMRSGRAKQCVCYEGFSGKSCKTAVPCPCAPEHGVCPDRKQPTVCRCKPGYSGPTCSTAAMAPALVLGASSRFENKGVANDNDDPEVYVHPTNKDDSVILGTTKSKDGDGGLHVWALDGTELWFAGVPKKSGLNSVDILMGVSVHDANGKATGEKADLALAGVRGSINAIGIWRIDPAAISANRRTLKANPNATQAELAPVLIPLTDHLRMFDKKTELEVYGSCAFAYTPRNATASTNTVLITTKDGNVHQFAVSLTRTEKEPAAALKLARKWTVGLGTQLENCVGDGEVGAVYIGEEAIGVWRYDIGQFAANEAIPSVTKPAIHPATGRFVIPIGQRHNGDLRQAVLVDATQLANPDGRLHRDVEGLGVYVDQAKGGKRMLVVSSQGANEYSFYDVTRSNVFPFRGLASIQAGPNGDAVTKTDSLAVSSARMGAFGRGMLVVHDDATAAGSDLARVQKSATFKVVSWAEVESRLSL